MSNATKTVKHKEQEINKGLQNSSMAKIRTNPGFHPISKGESFGGLAFVYARRNSAAARRPHQVWWMIGLRRKRKQIDSTPFLCARETRWPLNQRARQRPRSTHLFTRFWDRGYMWCVSGRRHPEESLVTSTWQGFFLARKVGRRWLRFPSVSSERKSMTNAIMAVWWLVGGSSLKEVTLKSLKWKSDLQYLWNFGNRISIFVDLKIKSCINTHKIWKNIFFHQSLSI